MSNKSLIIDDWVISKKDIVKVRRSEGNCLVCNKKLSIYNYGKFCFLHQFESTKYMDKLEQKRRCDQNRYYREKKCQEKKLLQQDQKQAQKKQQD